MLCCTRFYRLIKKRVKSAPKMKKKIKVRMELGTVLSYEHWTTYLNDGYFVGYIKIKNSQVSSFVYN